MRTRGRLETHFAGIARAKTSGVGEVVRTTPTRLLSYALANIQSVATTVTSVVFDGSYYVGIRSTGGSASSFNSTDGLNFSATGANGVEQWLNGYNMATNRAGTCIAVLQTASNTRLRRTTDHGVTWTACTLPSSVEWSVPVYCGDRWVTYNYLGVETAYSTDDGVNFVSGGNLPSTAAYGNICTAKGILAISKTGGGGVYYSYDMGLTWSGVTAPSGRGNIAADEKTGMFVLGNEWSGGGSASGFSFNARDWQVLVKPWSATYATPYAANGFISFYESPIVLDVAKGIWLDTPGISFRLSYGNGNYIAAPGYTFDAFVPVYEGVTE